MDYSENKEQIIKDNLKWADSLNHRLSKFRRLLRKHRRIKTKLLRKHSHNRLSVTFRKTATKLFREVGTRIESSDFNLWELAWR